MSDELQNPFVIQCKECRRILGDSFSLVSFKQNNLVLSSVSSSVYTREKKKIESTKSHDLKCHYLLVHCKCSKAVGKQYLTVDDELKDCIGHFCISRDSVSSFMLGTDLCPGEVTLTALADEISKIQRFCVALYKKIQRDR